jgi:hypothetical protein
MRPLRIERENGGTKKRIERHPGLQMHAEWHTCNPTDFIRLALQEKWEPVFRPEARTKRVDAPHFPLRLCRRPFGGRGAGGGFRLARSADRISLADVVEAVEGPIAMATCIDDTRHDCALEGACAVRPHMSVVNSTIRGALQSVSLAQLSQSVRPELVEGHSFSPTPAKEEVGFDRLSPNGVRLGTH